MIYRKIIRFVLVGAGFALGANRPALAASNPTPITMDALVHGEPVEGMPLAWSPAKVFLLERDGALAEFAPGDAQNFHKTSDSFLPYTQNLLRGMLEREFPQFEVSSTAHFLVVHPKGQTQWADRFEELYRSCVMYFTVRGFTLSTPQFPLVAIVFPTQDDFRHYAAKDTVPAGAGLLGYYSPYTNRVALFDIGNGRASNAQWQENYATAVHEASHQTAFNTGIHSRWSPPPRWVAEGLGTMFEARGVADSRTYPNQADRINRGRLHDFKALLGKRKPDSLTEMINSDREFESDTIRAYAQAWAFTFFLVEEMPREYARYLQKTASRPAFTQYTGAQRLKDFTDIFGENFALLDAHFLRFINELK
ncbi:MAG TPA: DUF1570 domain-containing protein [Pirellulales bacterium]|jgi:hypothetical protein|nr:DUF1570 domain-containing protein [Pirellulales bacterium]